MKYLKNVVTLKLNPDSCTGCGMCTVVCPHDVFIITDRKAVIRDRNACMECGACARNCPAEAIAVKAGVGCADAIIRGMLKGTGPDCACDNDSACCNSDDSSC